MKSIWMEWTNGYPRVTLKWKNNQSKSLLSLWNKHNFLGIRSWAMKQRNWQIMDNVSSLLECSPSEKRQSKLFSLSLHTPSDDSTLWEMQQKSENQLELNDSKSCFHRQMRTAVAVFNSTPKTSNKISPKRRNNILLLFESTKIACV